MACEAPKGRDATAAPASSGDEESDGGEGQKEMYTDEYIRLWEPLDPLDPDRMTDEHRIAIAEKMLKRNAVVYNRLAEL